jgi:hypothetical protein
MGFHMRVYGLLLVVSASGIAAANDTDDTTSAARALVERITTLTFVDRLDPKLLAKP